jgi:hypothetical protein
MEVIYNHFADGSHETLRKVQRHIAQHLEASQDVAKPDVTSIISIALSETLDNASHLGRENTDLEASTPISANMSR